MGIYCVFFPLAVLGFCLESVLLNLQSLDIMHVAGIWLMMCLYSFNLLLVIIITLVDLKANSVTKRFAKLSYQRVMHLTGRF